MNGEAVFQTDRAMEDGRSQEWALRLVLIFLLKGEKMRKKRAEGQKA